MGQVLMVGARILLPEVIDEGRRLIRALHASQFEVDAVFWLFLSESERWKLMIATPIRDREGAFSAYARLRSVRDAMDPPLRIETDDVALARGGDRRVRALQKRFDFKHARLDEVIEREGLDGEYIEAAYLYELSEIGAKKSVGAEPPSRH
ncbi:MAG: hypothetical protein ACLQGP_13765 [Isosphaeraceae bacterium]